MSRGPAPTVVVAVVSTNTREYLEPCLRSMEPDARTGLAEVWVVDNASTDGSPEMVRDDFPWARLIASEENLGYGPAINLVAGRTDSEWLAIANEDIELRSDTLERLLDAGARHPGTAVVSPRLELRDGSTQHSVHSFPTVPFTLGFNLRVHRLSRRLADRLCIEGAWDWSRPREVPWAIATFLLVRRSAFEEVGGFVDNQFMYGDDLDLGWRLKQAGWPARHEPGATVFHVGHVAGRKAFGPDLRARWMASTYGWMARRRGIARTWTVAFINVLGASLSAAAYTVLARVRPGRFGRRAAMYRIWARAHRQGLAAPRTLRSLGLAARRS